MELMFFLAVMYFLVPMLITHVRRLEAVPVVCGLMEGFAAAWMWSVITIVRIEGVVYAAMKPAGSVKPGPGTEEDAAIEPFRPVVAIRGTVIGRVIVITVRAGRRDADTDGNLCLCIGSNAKQCSYSRCCKKVLKSAHETPH